MLQKIKDALRVSGEALDEEIQDLIDAAKADLRLSGITKNEDDPLILRAITIYCKAHFGYEEPAQAELFMKSYNALKVHLALSREYIEVAEP